MTMTPLVYLVTMPSFVFEWHQLLISTFLMLGHLSGGKGGRGKRSRNEQFFLVPPYLTCVVLSYEKYDIVFSKHGSIFQMSMRLQELKDFY